MNDDKKVQFRLDDDELKQIDQMKPFGVSRSGFMKEMAFFGMESTITEADQRRRTEKKLIQELKEQTHINQAAINGTNRMIKELDEKVGYIPSLVNSYLAGNLVAFIKPTLEDIVKNAMDGIFHYDPSKMRDLSEKQKIVDSGHAPVEKADSTDNYLIASRVSAISDALTKLTEMGVFKQYLGSDDLRKIQGKA